MQIYQKVLFATDLSESNEAIAYKAYNIAKQFQADFYILHIIPAHNTIKYFYDQVSHFEDTLLTQGKEQLDLFCNKLDIMPDQSLVLTGEPSKAIQNTVKSKHIDLLILGSYGHSGLAHIIGSVTHRLLHYLPCELLILTP